MSDPETTEDLALIAYTLTLPSVRRNAFLRELFLTLKYDHFTKTGSGQT